MMKTEKKILDACCGSRMMWFNKNHPDAVYADIRSEQVVLNGGGGTVLNVTPDVVCDFRQMPFEDNTFRLVVFDPPHIVSLSPQTWMAQKYGRLFSTWKDDIRQGVNESMRVLQPGGVLIFKWNEAKIKLSEVLSCIDHQPLFGHTSGKHGRTIWMTFMK
jgi:ubiquinone/menaquinone biosynthesis C-methylase UbiE